MGAVLCKLIFSEPSTPFCCCSQVIIDIKHDHGNTSVALADLVVSGVKVAFCGDFRPRYLREF